jgi:hypothetical protein
MAGIAPERITADNGSEFAGRILEAWAMEHHVQLCFIRPGRPTENGFIESLAAGSGTSVSTSPGSRLWRTPVRRSQSGGSNTTDIVRTAPCRTELRWEFAALQDRRTGGRFALSIVGKATGNPCQGRRQPAVRTLDRGCRLPLIELKRGRTASANRPRDQRPLSESLAVRGRKGTV